jgi:signal transduction histidine kinase
MAIAVDRHRVAVELVASREELVASRDELRRSRARIVEAGDRERRRITQNLHDGLQVQLVLLAMEAQAIAAHAEAAPPIRRAGDRLRAGLDAAAANLRQLVQEVMPSALIERGLGAAAEDLVDRMPMPTRLSVAITDGSLPPPVATTAYFVVAEGLTNAVKYSSARHVDVRVARNRDQLVVTVHDDGIGGATPGGGAGLQSLADRVDALGGSLRLFSPPGGGTQLQAVLPCEAPLIDRMPAHAGDGGAVQDTT